MSYCYQPYLTRTALRFACSTFNISPCAISAAIGNWVSLIYVSGSFLGPITTGFGTAWPCTPWFPGAVNCWYDALNAHYFCTYVGQVQDCLHQPSSQFWLQCQLTTWLQQIINVYGSCTLGVWRGANHTNAVWLMAFWWLIIVCHAIYIGRAHGCTLDSCSTAKTTFL